MAYVILILSLYLDGLLTNLFPYLPNDLSLFTPMLTLVGIYLIYPLFRKKEKNYFITIFIAGMIYDLLYTNLLFLDGLIFLLFGYIIQFIYKNLDVCHIKISIHIIFLIILYESIMAILILIFSLVPITLDSYIYKIKHSILLNILYGEVLLFLIRLLPKKLKRININ